MRSLMLLVIGVLAGVVGTVMFVSVDTTFQDGGSDGPGGGNLRIVLDETALATIIRERIVELDEMGADTTVAVNVNSNGLLDVAIGAGVSPVGVVTELVLDPEVIDGELAIVVVDAQMGGISAPDRVAGAIEGMLRSQLADAARGIDYRLTTITTTENELTLEMEI